MSKQHEKDIIFGFSYSIMGALLVSLIILRDNQTLTFTSVLPLCVIGCTVYLLNVLVISLAIYCIGNIMKRIDYGVLEEYFRLIALKISAKRRSKNSEIIAPRLRYFLFSVLDKNKEFLDLPIGENELSLTLDGLVFRQNCSFYRFSMILPEDLEQDTETLRQLIQSYIEQELATFGCYGLRSAYGNDKYGSWWSIYLDKIEPNEKLHRLSFELLYISNTYSAIYRKQIFDRENTVPKQEKTVYDDEIR